MGTKTQLILAISFSVIIAITLLGVLFAFLWLDETRKSITNPENEETVEVVVYFGREGTEEIFPVTRSLSSREEIERKTLEELLKGVQRDEENYFSSINSGVEIQQFRIENKTAFADFTEKLDEGVAGSARVFAIREQIEKTLTQFETINEVIISINGRVNDILQP